MNKLLQALVVEFQYDPSALIRAEKMQRLIQALDAFAASDIANDSSVTGATVKDALNWLLANIGSGGVPSTRTITINGTTQDLSANRSWTIATPPAYTSNQLVVGNGVAGGTTYANALFDNTGVLKVIDSLGSFTIQDSNLNQIGIVVNGAAPSFSIFNSDNFGSLTEWKWPNADGGANQVLKTDGAGNLGWSTPAVLPTYTVNQIVVGNAGSGTGFADFTWNDSTGDFFAGNGSTHLSMGMLASTQFFGVRKLTSANNFEGISFYGVTGSGAGSELTAGLTLNNKIGTFILGDNRAGGAATVSITANSTYTLNGLGGSGAGIVAVSNTGVLSWLATPVSPSYTTNQIVFGNGSAGGTVSAGLTWDNTANTFGSLTVGNTHNHLYINKTLTGSIGTFTGSGFGNLGVLDVTPTVEGQALGINYTGFDWAGIERYNDQNAGVYYHSFYTQSAHSTYGSGGQSGFWGTGNDMFGLPSGNQTGNAVSISWSAGLNKIILRATNIILPVAAGNGAQLLTTDNTGLIVAVPASAFFTGTLAAAISGGKSVINGIILA